MRKVYYFNRGEQIKISIDEGLAFKIAYRNLKKAVEAVNKAWGVKV